jgi:HD-GYP domain-containing protein (c-di-GMP phosphodiesterase class II)
VHDLGKLSIPAEILTKPTRLTEIEYQLIRQHPLATYELLKGIDFPWPVATIALQHHERLDGSGYPHGLRGIDMLPEARVLAVADVFEAMSSNRPYRPPSDPTRRSRSCSATRHALRPRRVDACVRLIREDGLSLV